MSDELLYRNFKLEDTPDGVTFKRKNDNIEINIEVQTLIGFICGICLIIFLGWIAIILIDEILSQFSIIYTVIVVIIGLIIRLFVYEVIYCLIGTYKIEINGLYCCVSRYVKYRSLFRKIKFNFSEVNNIRKKNTTSHNTNNPEYWIVFIETNSKNIRLDTLNMNIEAKYYLLGALNKIKIDKCGNK